MTEDQKQLYLLFSRAHLAHAKRTIENDERMISLMKLIHSQIELVSSHLEIGELPAIQADFRSVLASVESEHETQLAEMRDLQDEFDSL